jgi:hypothetical protein
MYIKYDTHHQSRNPDRSRPFRTEGDIPTTFHHYQAQWPPSMRKSLPVMKLLASLSRNTAAPRNSSGILSRFSMLPFAHSSRLSGYVSNNASVIAVTMYPGEMVLTRIPY